jgi:glycosyltransferase involved in cell wall biosynthesis
MKVSLITVCFNSEKTIRDTIKSVLKQDYKNIEYIIVDGGSTDSTLNIINEYKDKIDCLISEPDKNLYDGINKGLKIAKGEVIGIINSDDFYESDSIIRSVVEMFARNEQTEVVFGDIYFVKPKNITKISRIYSPRNFKPWKMRFGWMPPHTGTFIKKTIYDQVGFYSLDFKIASDYEFFIRLFVLQKAKFTYLNKIILIMRSGGLSTSSLKSNWIITNEIKRACLMNGVFTNNFLLAFRFFFKFYEQYKKINASKEKSL